MLQKEPQCLFRIPQLDNMVQVASPLTRFENVRLRQTQKRSCNEPYRGRT